MGDNLPPHHFQISPQPRQIGIASSVPPLHPTPSPSPLTMEAPESKAPASKRSTPRRTPNSAKPIPSNPSPPATAASKKLKGLVRSDGPPPAKVAKVSTKPPMKAKQKLTTTRSNTGSHKMKAPSRKVLSSNKKAPRNKEAVRNRMLNMLKVDMVDVTGITEGPRSRRSVESFQLGTENTPENKELPKSSMSVKKNVPKSSPKSPQPPKIPKRSDRGKIQKSPEKAKNKNSPERNDTPKSPERAKSQPKQGSFQKIGKQKPQASPKKSKKKSAKKPPPFSPAKKEAKDSNTVVAKKEDDEKGMRNRSLSPHLIKKNKVTDSNRAVAKKQDAGQGMRNRSLSPLMRKRSLSPRLRNRSLSPSAITGDIKVPDMAGMKSCNIEIEPLSVSIKEFSGSETESDGALSPKKLIREAPAKSAVLSKSPTRSLSIRRASVGEVPQESGPKLSRSSRHSLESDFMIEDPEMLFKKSRGKSKKDDFLKTVKSLISPTRHEIIGDLIDSSYSSAESLTIQNLSGESEAPVLKTKLSIPVQLGAKENQDGPVDSEVEQEVGDVSAANEVQRTLLHDSEMTSNDRFKAPDDVDTIAPGEANVGEGNQIPEKVPPVGKASEQQENVAKTLEGADLHKNIEGHSETPKSEKKKLLLEKVKSKLGKTDKSDVKKKIGDTTVGETDTGLEAGTGNNQNSSDSGIASVSEHVIESTGKVVGGKDKKPRLASTSEDLHVTFGLDDTGPELEAEQEVRLQQGSETRGRVENWQPSTLNVLHKSASIDDHVRGLQPTPTNVRKVQSSSKVEGKVVLPDTQNLIEGQTEPAKTTTEKEKPEESVTGIEGCDKKSVTFGLPTRSSQLEKEAASSQDWVPSTLNILKKSASVDDEMPGVNNSGDGLRKTKSDSVVKDKVPLPNIEEIDENEAQRPGTLALEQDNSVAVDNGPRIQTPFTSPDLLKTESLDADSNKDLSSGDSNMLETAETSNTLKEAHGGQENSHLQQDEIQDQDASISTWVPVTNQIWNPAASFEENKENKAAADSTVFHESTVNLQEEVSQTLVNNTSVTTTSTESVSLCSELEKDTSKSQAEPASDNQQSAAVTNENKTPSPLAADSSAFTDPCDTTALPASIDCPVPVDTPAPSIDLGLPAEPSPDAQPQAKEDAAP